MRGTFQRRLTALAELLDFVDGFVSEYGLDDRTAFAARLVVDELFANLVRHNRGGGDRIEVELSVADDALVLRLWDHNVEPFEVPCGTPVEIGCPLDERTAGGLGLHFVRSYFDDLTYDYCDRTVCVTATKRLRRPDVHDQTH